MSRRCRGTAGCRAQRISSDRWMKRVHELNGPESERITFANGDRVTVSARCVAASRTEAGSTFTRVFLMIRCSFGQLAPLVEAESENSSKYSHVIKMDTLTRRSCAGAPRNCNRGSQLRLHGCSRHSRTRPQRRCERHLAAAVATSRSNWRDF